MVLACVVNVGLNLVLIPEHGAVGAAWASSVAYGLAAVYLALAYAREQRVSLTALCVPRPADLQGLLDAIRLRDRAVLQRWSVPPHAKPGQQFSVPGIGDAAASQHYSDL